MPLLPLCPGQARSGLGRHQLICEFRTTPRRSSFVVRRSSFGESVRVDPTRRVVHPARPSQAVRHPRHATTGTSNVIRALLAHWRPQLGGLTVLVTARTGLRASTGHRRSPVNSTNPSPTKGPPSGRQLHIVFVRHQRVSAPGWRLPGGVHFTQRFFYVFW